MKVVLLLLVLFTSPLLFSIPGTEVSIQGIQQGNQYIFQMPKELEKQGLEFVPKDLLKLKMSELNVISHIFRCRIEGKLVATLFGRPLSDERKRQGPPLLTIEISMLENANQNEIPLREQAHQKAVEALDKKQGLDITTKLELQNELLRVRDEERLTDKAAIERMMAVWAVATTRSNLSVEKILRLLKEGTVESKIIFLGRVNTASLNPELRRILMDLLAKVSREVSLQEIRRPVQQEIRKQLEKKTVCVKALEPKRKELPPRTR